MKQKYTLALSSALLAVALAGCDDSDSGDGKTGVFVDSPVANIKYRTESKSGYTGPDGSFSYEEGENVTFSIGDIDLPSSQVKPVVTLFDLVGTENVRSDRLINIARLLQTLDVDGDPSNGIVISDQAHSSAAGMTISFEGESFDEEFAELCESRPLDRRLPETPQTELSDEELDDLCERDSSDEAFTKLYGTRTFDSQVTNLIANSGSVLVELKTAEQALDHIIESYDLPEFYGISNYTCKWVTEEEENSLIEEGTALVKKNCNLKITAGDVENTVTVVYSEGELEDIVSYEYEGLVDGYILTFGDEFPEDSYALYGVIRFNYDFSSFTGEVVGEALDDKGVKADFKHIIDDGGLSAGNFFRIKPLDPVELPDEEGDAEE